MEEKQITTEVQTARQFWQNLMTQYTWLAGLVLTIVAAAKAVGQLLYFIVSGRIFVSLARLLMEWCGYVAESALFLCVLWVTAAYLAPTLVELFMPEKTMSYLVSCALIALALIPEAILGNTIVKAVKHWLAVIRLKSIEAWIWAVMITLPALAFFILTAITLATLTSTHDLVKTGTSILTFRVLAGWLYGLLEIVYAKVGREVLVVQAPTQSPTQPTQMTSSTQIEELTETVSTLAKQVVQINQTILQITQNNVYVGSSTPSTQVAEVTYTQPTQPLKLNAHKAQAGLKMLTMVNSQMSREDASEDDAAVCVEEPTQTTQVTYPTVPGVSAAKVKQLIDAVEAGANWRELTGNYSQTIKPVRDVYERLHKPTQVV